MKKGCKNCVFKEKNSKSITCGNKKRNDKQVLDNGKCDYYIKKSILHSNLPEIKKYVLSEPANINDFLTAGFTLRKLSEGSEKLVLNKFLTNKILLSIDIILDNQELLFDDAESIYVMDIVNHQFYYPFYTCQTGFGELNEVIRNYNKFMDRLVEQGIFSIQK